MAQNNTMAAVAYIFGWLSGLIVYLISKDDKFARFHGLQAILWNIMMVVLMFISVVLGIVLMIVLGIVAGAANLGGLGAILVMLPWLLVALFGLVLILYTLWSIYQAWSGKWHKIPLVGGLAEKWSA